MKLSIYTKLAHKGKKREKNLELQIEQDVDAKIVGL
jgi:hypothetical protein